MRQNLPVTQAQKPIPAHYRIVSRTDLQGNILEANDEFIEISGYTEQELMGQPHNILRHPDVPSIVFADMWQTLKSGCGWTQIVKNRCKNGDHYWVKANAAPILENNQITGYISVRVPASDAEIALASQAYPLIAQGKLIIKKGQVFTPWQAKLKQLNPFHNWTLIQKTLLGNVLFILLAALALLGLRDSLLQQSDVAHSVNLFTFTTLGLLLAMSAFFISANYIFIARPLATLRTLIRTSQQSGDISLRSPIHNHDEIGQLALAFNEQMQNMQVAIGETGRLLAAIAHGKLNIQSNLPMQGDFEILKRNANIAGQTMKQTTEEITQLLYEIRNGNFSYETNTNLQGDYATAIHHGITAMVTLKGVFFEVNELMAQVSKGYFNKRIKAQAHGELKLLKDNINQTLDQLEQAIAQTTQVMVAQGAGDLTKHIEMPLHGTLSILKDGVNNATANVSSLMSQSNYSIVKLSEGTHSIRQGIQDLAQRTQQQAASLEETAASMEQITSTIRQTADNAEQAQKLSTRSHQEAMAANQVVKQTIEAIHRINDSSSKIAEITNLIDSIAFQTNLLALNAAVEAARAGEHGRGFAVVAGEVRSLAQKSSEAAKEIRHLIDDTLKKVEHGTDLANQSGQALTVINDSIDNVTQIIDEINQATREQSAGVEQVNNAVAAIDTATQKNAALVEETAEQTQQMAVYADQVIELSKMFKIDISAIHFETAMQTGQFAFAQARRAHRQWKGLITAYIAGMDIGLNREAATDHTKCGLGKWFYGEEGQKYYHLDEMKKVEKWHAELHATIKRILEAHESKDIEMVEREFDKLDQCSEQVIRYLTESEQKVAQLAGRSVPPKRLGQTAR
ncbi:MAG: methyl-accepting chemotaxis protein [Thiomicrospira sp.]|jgi:methyl-accepting chemotaxis protein|nr:methyl-accepting chemotaxis protein [Thiomicrospira sp.]